MQDKTAYIDYILNCLNTGIVERKDIMAKFGEKWQVPSRTFDRYLQKANEAYKIEREAIENAKREETIKNELEAHKSNILEKDKILEMQSNLVKLAYNKMVKLKEPTPSDLMAYNATVERYSKLKGLDAAKQIEQKNTFEDLKIKGIIISD